jgi:hypothetical protein
MKTLFSTILLFFAALLASCGPKTEIITNTYSTAEPGNVKGTVKLFDTNGVAISDASGVKVFLEGTTYSTFTASDGTWELTNVPAGTYPSLMYSKAGFPTYKSYQSATQGQFGKSGNIGAYIIGGGGTQYDAIQNFYQISNISVNLTLRGFFDDFKEIIVHYILIDSTSTYSYVYDTIITPNAQAKFSSRILDNRIPNMGYQYEGVLFFGKSPNIDPTDAKTFLFESCFNYGYFNDGYYYKNGTGYDPSFTQSTNINTGNANFTINKLFLQSVGFIPGETVYCVAYFGNHNIYYNYYIDPETGMIIFPGFSPYHSEVRTFILTP